MEGGGSVCRGRMDVGGGKRLEEKDEGMRKEDHVTKVTRKGNVRVEDGRKGQKGKKARGN